ncbi:MAG: GNAT family N-acetyltransferase [Legionella sp.]|nr:GNAT family N-acetyltransferase [Legionella sp.]
MFITKAIAQQLESCIKQSHIEVTKRYGHGQFLELSTGAACFSGVDSYLSQVVGWGFDLKPQQYASELNKIEQFYKTVKHNRVDIEFCPYTGNDLAIFLSENGYSITELNNVCTLDLLQFDPVPLLSGGFVIRELKADEIEDWAMTIAIGFDYPPAQEQFVQYAQAKNILVFGVFDKKSLIAGATLALHHPMCDLAVTSTLPEYRNLGLQKKLLITRLNYAKQRGLKLAMVTTEPGSISELNGQKVGFRCAYTRIKLTRLAL